MSKTAWTGRARLHDSCGRYPLLNERPHWIVKNMVDGDDLRERGSIRTVAYSHAPFATNGAILANKTITADADNGLGQITEIIDNRLPSVLDAMLTTGIIILL